MDNIFEQVEKNIDNLVANSVDWTACAGAEVTVIDISNKMLDKDRKIAKSENLPIEIAKGNMCDLSMLNNCYFDYIINPPSLWKSI